MTSVELSDWLDSREYLEVSIADHTYYFIKNSEYRLKIRRLCDRIYFFYRGRAVPDLERFIQLVPKSVFMKMMLDINIYKEHAI